MLRAALIALALTLGAEPVAADIWEVSGISAYETDWYH